MKGILLCSLIPLLIILHIEPHSGNDSTENYDVVWVIMWILISVNYIYVQTIWRDKPALKISTNWKIDGNENNTLFIIQKKLERKYFSYVVMMSSTIILISYALFSQWWYSSIILGGMILIEMHGIRQILKLSRDISTYRPELEEEWLERNRIEGLRSQKTTKNVSDEKYPSSDLKKYYDNISQLNKKYRIWFTVVVCMSVFLISLLIIFQISLVAVYPAFISLIIFGVQTIRKIRNARRSLKQLRDNDFMQFEDKSKLT